MNKKVALLDIALLLIKTAPLDISKPKIPQDVAVSTKNSLPSDWISWPKLMIGVVR